MVTQHSTISTYKTGVVAVTDRHYVTHALYRQGRGLTLRCKLVGGQYVFSGGTQGQDRLDVKSTDATTLLGHWFCYCLESGLGAWEVRKVTLIGQGQGYYRYAIEGFNWYTQERFSWSVRGFDSETYDLSGVVVPELSSAEVRA